LYATTVLPFIARFLVKGGAILWPFLIAAKKFRAGKAMLQKRRRTHESLRVLLLGFLPSVGKAGADSPLRYAAEGVHLQRHKMRSFVMERRAAFCFF